MLNATVVARYFSFLATELEKDLHLLKAKFARAFRQRRPVSLHEFDLTVSQQRLYIGNVCSFGSMRLSRYNYIGKTSGKQERSNEI